MLENESKDLLPRFGIEIELTPIALHDRSRLFMATLTGQSCWALVAQALLAKFICVQRCLSIAAVVESSCGPMVIHQKDEKSTRSRSFEEPPLDFTY
jgi:hypothetical protein